MPALHRRGWVPPVSEDLVQGLAATVDGATPAELRARVERLTVRSRERHEVDAFNLNPATNVMNPRAEALLSAGLSTRASLGWPGQKYETGLESIEEIEVLAAELTARVFRAPYAEVRLPSGGIANLATFMATCSPGDAIVVPSPAVGGHVTHHRDGAAGLYGLDVHTAPVDPDTYSVDLHGLADLVARVRPRLVTIGGSLNLFPHPVAAVREVADTVGATVLFDAAHQCGIIAGGAFPDPLAAGAHVMTFSTYKSLGGPAGGVAVTTDAGIAERLDLITHPGLTANFDASITAALAITMADWVAHGEAYATTMVAVAHALATALHDAGLPVHAADRGFTRSHQFAIEAARWGGGQAASARLHRAGFLASGIGLPIAEVPGDLNGLRLGTPELVRWGVTVDDVPALAELLVRALTVDDPSTVAADTRRLRADFRDLHFVN